MQIKNLISLLSALLFCGLLSAQMIVKDDQFGMFETYSGPCLNEQQRVDIQARLNASIKNLKTQGNWPAASIREVPSLHWPLQPVEGFRDYGYHGISNFVDHNPQIGMVRDFNCGDRSYDTPEGYNHAGTDFFLWPFGWKLMDEDQVQVVAASSGIIIGKDDGFFDKNCSRSNSNTWNAVYIKSPDGMVAWYGHLKSNSLTKKNIGEHVEAGEYLGIVGSSGASNGPHLHFELHDSLGNIIDPFIGDCNELGSASFWDAQPPYYDSGINRISTHTELPVDPGCPASVIANDAVNFCAEDKIYFVVYLRDQRRGQILKHTIFQPDFTIFDQWENSLPEGQSEHFNASFMYKAATLPQKPREGQWTYRVEFLDKIYIHNFNVCSSSEEPANQIPISIRNLFPNPVHSELHALVNVRKGNFYQFKITNVLSYQVRRTILSMKEGQQQVSFNTENLLPGFYFLEVYDLKNNLILAKKFIKY